MNYLTVGQTEWYKAPPSGGKSNYQNAIDVMRESKPKKVNWGLVGIVALIIIGLAIYVVFKSGLIKLL